MQVLDLIRTFFAQRFREVEEEIRIRTGRVDRDPGLRVGERDIRGGVDPRNEVEAGGVRRVRTEFRQRIGDLIRGDIAFRERPDPLEGGEAGKLLTVQLLLVDIAEGEGIFIFKSALGLRLRDQAEEARLKRVRLVVRLVGDEVAAAEHRVEVIVAVACPEEIRGDLVGGVGPVEGRRARGGRVGVGGGGHVAVDQAFVGHIVLFAGRDPVEVGVGGEDVRDGLLGAVVEEIICEGVLREINAAVQGRVVERDELSGKEQGHERKARFFYALYQGGTHKKRSPQENENRDRNQRLPPHRDRKAAAASYEDKEGGGHENGSQGGDDAEAHLAVLLKERAHEEGHRDHLHKEDNEGIPLGDRVEREDTAGPLEEEHEERDAGKEQGLHRAFLPQQQEEHREEGNERRGEQGRIVVARGSGKCGARPDEIRREKAGQVGAVGVQVVGQQERAEAGGSGVAGAGAAKEARGDREERRGGHEERADGAKEQFEFAGEEEAKARYGFHFPVFAGLHERTEEHVERAEDPAHVEEIVVREKEQSEPERKDQPAGERIPAKDALNQEDHDREHEHAAAVAVVLAPDDDVGGKCPREGGQKGGCGISGEQAEGVVGENRDQVVLDKEVEHDPGREIVPPEEEQHQLEGVDVLEEGRGRVLAEAAPDRIVGECPRLKEAGELRDDRVGGGERVGADVAVHEDGVSENEISVEDEKDRVCQNKKRNDRVVFE